MEWTQIDYRDGKVGEYIGFVKNPIYMYIWISKKKKKKFGAGVKRDR